MKTLTKYEMVVMICNRSGHSHDTGYYKKVADKRTLEQMRKAWRLSQAGQSSLAYALICTGIFY